MKNDTKAKLIDVGREIKSRDYKAEDEAREKSKSKDANPRIYKTRKEYPKLTIVGKQELGQMKFGEEATILVKIKAVGFSSRRDWESEDGEKKVPEAEFEVISMEVPKDAMPISKKVFESTSYNPLDDIGMPADDDND